MTKKATKRKAKKRPTGRPRIEIDADLVCKLAKIHCTYEEIGAIVGCSHDTLERRLREDPEFRARVERAYAEGKASVRREMWRSALDGGDTKMLIWLSKNHLGMRDRIESETHVTGDPVIVQIPTNGREPDEDPDG